MQGADELELKNENHELRKLFTHFKVKKNLCPSTIYIVFSSGRKTVNLTVHSQYGIFPQADEMVAVFFLLLEVFTFWAVFFPGNKLESSVAHDVNEEK